MSSRTGRTQNGNTSEHTLENTGARCFLIVEQDGVTVRQTSASRYWRLLTLQAASGPEIARAALVELCADSDVADENTGIKLLAAIREIFQERGTDRISTKDLLGELIDRDGDEPWAACWQKDFNAENIKGPAAKLARLLKPLG
jgi:Protein of unknown function (DUF3631)